MIKNIFSEAVSNEVIERINCLKPSDQPLWGKMSADQVLAHCNVIYNFIFEPEKYSKPGFLKRFLLKTFVKKFVVNDKPYPKSSMTAPEFIIQNPQDFEREKQKLINNIQKVQKLGMHHFDGKENFSFGKMTSEEWNAMFYKHLDHHLKQFGV